MQDDILEVNDAREHEYFKYNPNVTGDFGLVYYVGVPLRTTDGYNIGTLCLVGHEPNRLTKSQREQIQILADEVVTQFELNLSRYQLETLNKEKDELLKIVSHDMRGPLMGIIGFAEVLKNEAEPGEQREFLEIIENSGQALLGIVNVLLKADFITNADSFRIHLQKTDLVPLLEESSTLMKPFILLKNQQLEIVCPDELIATVDAEQWKQIVGNLLHNASKFTPVGGKVSITLQRAEEPKKYVLSVQDNGMGMSAEMVSQLFTGTKDIQRKGTSGEDTSGLGMTTIDKYVKMHMGDIQVVSAPGEGTTFIITMPI